MTDLRNSLDISCAGLKPTDSLKKRVARGPMVGIIIEPKYDGHHYTWQFGDGCYLVSRGREDATKGVDAAKGFRNVEPHEWMRRVNDYADEYFGGACMLECEMIAANGGTASDATRKDSEKAFVVYDCLFAFGQDVRDEPLDLRREKASRLVSIIRGLPGMSNVPLTMSTAVEYDRIFDADRLETYLDRIRKEGVEGYVVKMLDQPYGPTVGWKIKVKDTADGIVSGWTRGKAHNLGTVTKTDYVGSLLVDQWLDTDQGLVKAQVAEIPMAKKMRIPLTEAEQWLGKVVEFEHRGWDPYSVKYRFPQFVRFRDDKPAEECKA